MQSVNPGGASTNSPHSTGTTASGALSTSAPAAPTGLAVTSVGHQSVTLNWTASPGANFYTIYRSTLVNNGGGASNVLNTIVLANNVTGTGYTDTSPTDGSIYRYFVTATSAGGTSSNSASAAGVPLPAPPASAPGSLTGNFVQTTNVLLNWSPVSGAVGYIIRRATSPGGPFTFLMSVTETTYTDIGLNVALGYYYQVAAVNAAGVSANATVAVTAPPSAPVSLSAIPGNSQITLNWSAVANATGYYLYRGPGSGNETTLVAGNYVGTSYTNTGLANGTTYFYVVAATNSVGLSPNSPEASATPGVNIAGGRNLTWVGDGSANLWNVSGAANWLTNGVATVFYNGDTVTFDNTANNLSANLAGTLQPALVTVNASKNYTFSGGGSIAGTNMLIKAGTGTLTINTTNTYSGGTVLSNGTATLGNISANLVGLGSGPITFDGGTLEFNGWTGNNGTDYGGNTNSLVVPANQAGTIHNPQRFLTPGLAGALSGSGTLNLQVKYVRGDVSGDWSSFTGRINVTYSSGGSTIDHFRVANANGFPGAKLNIGSNVLMYSRAASGSIIPIGEFSGALGAAVSADGAGGLGGMNTVTWRVGELDTDATNAASFQGIAALIKEGTGTWTLTGASTHTGTTVLSNGTLLVNGSFNGSPVTVNGGTLGGIGSISGAAVTVNSGGGFTPGSTAGFGPLTISNNLTLAAGSTTFMRIQHSPLTNNVANVAGTMTEGGTLVVTNIGASALTNGDSFQLFNAGNYSGAFAGFVLPPLANGQAWNTYTLNTSGTLSVVVLTPPTIASPNLVGGSVVIGGSGGVNSWPYYLLASTNLTSPSAQWARVATNQFDGNGHFIITNAINPNWPQTFYRLQLQ